MDEARHDHVVERRTAGGQENFAGGVKVFAFAVAREIDQQVEEVADQRLGLGAGGGAEQAFETLHAAQCQVRRGRFHCAGNPHAGFAVTHAGAAAHGAAFQQHLQRPPDIRGTCGIGKHCDAGFAVDETVKIQRGVAAQFFQHVAHRLPAHQLVRQHNSGKAEIAGHLDLLRRRQGDSPGTVLELA